MGSVEFGYNLSSEEHAPNDLVRNAQQAEALGFDFAMISDHYHPWLDRQGQGSFVWSVVGAVAHATERLQLGTGVTCPIMRIHPAIIAQAAATAAAMMPGRFFLGVGSGENLNEHILGEHWPSAPIRLAMLEEAVQVIRQLWQGEEISHFGDYYTVENARLYTLPNDPPPIYVASAGEKSAKLAGKIGDGLIMTSQEEAVLKTFEVNGGTGKPCFGKVDVCVAANEAEAGRIAFQQWKNTGVKGQLNQELATPTLIEQAASLVLEEDVTEKILCSLDPEKHLEKIQKLMDMGFDHIYIHQIGPDQESFFRFYEKRILPKLV